MPCCSSLETRVSPAPTIPANLIVTGLNTYAERFASPKARGSSGERRPAEMNADGNCAIERRQVWIENRRCWVGGGDGNKISKLLDVVGSLRGAGARRAHAPAIHPAVRLTLPGRLGTPGRYPRDRTGSAGAGRSAGGRLRRGQGGHQSG